MPDTLAEDCEGVHDVSGIIYGDDSCPFFEPTRIRNYFQPARKNCHHTSPASLSRCIRLGENAYDMFLMLLGELYVTVGGWMISRGLDYVRSVSITEVSAVGARMGRNGMGRRKDGVESTTGIL